MNHMHFLEKCNTYSENLARGRRYLRTRLYKPDIPSRFLRQELILFDEDVEFFGDMWYNK